MSRIRPKPVRASQTVREQRARAFHATQRLQVTEETTSQVLDALAQLQLQDEEMPDITLSFNELNIVAVLNFNPPPRGPVSAMPFRLIALLDRAGLTYTQPTDKHGTTLPLLLSTTEDDDDQVIWALWESMPILSETRSVLHTKLT